MLIFTYFSNVVKEMYVMTVKIIWKSVKINDYCVNKFFRKEKKVCSYQFNIWYVLYTGTTY